MRVVVWQPGNSASLLDIDTTIVDAATKKIAELTQHCQELHAEIDRLNKLLARRKTYKKGKECELSTVS